MPKTPSSGSGKCCVRQCAKVRTSLSFKWTEGPTFGMCDLQLVTFCLSVTPTGEDKHNGNIIFRVRTTQLECSAPHARSQLSFNRRAELVIRRSLI